MDKKETILAELKYWETEYKPSNNIGKWAQQTKINILKEELKKLEDGQIENKKGTQQKDSKKKS